MEKAQKITKEMKISEVLRKYPKTSLVFSDYGLHCLGCPLVEPETISDVAKIHQINFKKFLKDLNKAAEKK